LNKTKQIPKKIKITENNQEHRNEPSNMEPKTNQIWSKQRNIHVGNHVRINNITSIHFNYNLKIMILSKSFLVQNQSSRIKNYLNTLLMRINTRLLVNHV
jgi:hypothetical protein